MTSYAIGDVQGCYSELQCLLDRIAFNPKQDEIWFLGDLVNRGEDSLKALRFAHSIDARLVLGNHDLHMLACYYSARHQLKKKDTLAEIFSAPDSDELMHWMLSKQMVHWDQERNLVLSHAGIPHFWSASEALALGREVESVLRGENRQTFFDNMYGNLPDAWSPELEGVDRWRVITNYLTRMRFIGEKGQLDFAAKEDLASGPKGFKPWFTCERADDTRIVFGHWAAIQGKTGSKQFVALDTGCVWGGQLTAMNLDSGERIACDCRSHHKPAKHS